MSFFGILLALLLEQARPLARGNMVHAAMRAWLRWVVRSFDAGHPHHGWLVWWMAVGAPSLAALIIHWVLLLQLGWFATMVWSVAVLYATLGFRQFSHRFTGIRDALEAGDEEHARGLLADWQQIDAHELPRSEIIRHVIEHSVLAAHRHVFGVLSWYTVLAALGLGPTGAVFFRLAELVSRYWQHVSVQRSMPVSDSTRAAASAAWRFVDWAPARITAMGFAVVGSFEDAVDNWRHHELRRPGDNDGVIVAATAGAVNVRLGDALAQQTVEQDDTMTFRPEPEIAHLRSIVGLVWRSVVMWMVMLALLTLANLLG
jgi:adenosylcobinamide-phosphate synthase